MRITLTFILLLCGSVACSSFGQIVPGAATRLTWTVDLEDHEPHPIEMRVVPTETWTLHNGSLISISPTNNYIEAAFVALSPSSSGWLENYKADAEI